MYKAWARRNGYRMFISVYILCLWYVMFDHFEPKHNYNNGQVFLGWTSTKLWSKTTTQWRRWDSNPRSHGLESSTLPLSHCAPFEYLEVRKKKKPLIAWGWDRIKDRKICWRADDGPTLNTGLVALWIFRGSVPVLLKYPICYWFFRGSWSPAPPPPPPMDPRMSTTSDLKRSHRWTRLWCTKYCTRRLLSGLGSIYIVSIKISMTLAPRENLTSRRATKLDLHQSTYCDQLRPAPVWVFIETRRYL